MLALPVINHVIQQNPHTQAQLQQYAGRSLRLVLPLLTLDAVLDGQGCLQPTKQAPQTTIHVQNSAVQKWLQGGKPGVGDVRIAGDQGLAMALLPFLDELRYEGHDDIARWFGNDVADEVMRFSGSLKDSAGAWWQNLAAHIGDYAQAADAPVVSQQVLARFAAAVDALRDDAARLEARLRRLEKR